MSSQILEPTDVAEAVMSDGVQLKLRRYAHETGPRLVITHGNGFAVDGYRVFWEPLLETFDVVVFDMRNHGQNTPSGADGHHYKQLSCDVASVRAAVTSHWGTRPTAGVFHSMSSRSAMKQAVEGDWIWDALVLFDPPNVPPEGHPLHKLMRRFEGKLIDYSLNRQNHFDSVVELVESFRTAPGSKSWLPQAMEDMAHAVLRPDGGEGYGLSCRRELEAAIYLAALSLDLWPSAKEIGGPFTMICGDPERERPAPTSLANKALAEEGGYHYQAIAETGHLLQIERPEACREAMISFLKSVDAMAL